MDLQRENIHFANGVNLQSKIQLLRECLCSSRLSVVADFDRTISARNSNSSHGVIEKCGLLSDDYHTRARELFETYYPIEISPTATLEERTQACETWWNAAHGLLIKEQLTSEKVAKAVENCSDLVLRDRFDEVLQLLETNSVPLLVFSAGFGDVIKAALLRHSGVWRTEQRNDLRKVVANMAAWDESGRLTGFEEPLVHSCNKGAVVKQLLQQQQQQQGCGSQKTSGENRCVLLLGDGIGDADMAAEEDGVVVLRVAFLNFEVEKNLDRYLSKFDIVLTADPDFSLVLEMLSGGGNSGL